MSAAPASCYSLTSSLWCVPSLHLALTIAHRSTSVSHPAEEYSCLSCSLQNSLSTSPNMVTYPAMCSLSSLWPSSKSPLFWEKYPLWHRRRVDLQISYVKLDIVRKEFCSSRILDAAQYSLNDIIEPRLGTRMPFSRYPYTILVGSSCWRGQAPYVKLLKYTYYYR